MALAFPPQAVRLAESSLLQLDIAGAESNLCIGLSRLGVGARFISRVGNDPFGERIRSVLAQEGVDTQALVTDPEAPTGVFFREHLPDGQRRVYYYRQNSAASKLSPDDLQPALFSGARLVHLTGINSTHIAGRLGHDEIRLKCCQLVEIDVIDRAVDGLHLGVNLAGCVVFVIDNGGGHRRYRIDCRRMITAV